MIIKKKLMSFLKVIVKIAGQGKFLLQHMVKLWSYLGKMNSDCVFNAIVYILYMYVITCIT